MKFILLFFLFCVTVTVNAQDVIVKKDGSTILSKVLEVNTDDIKYKKFSNLNGPTYTMSKADILAVNYENGEKDSFDSKSDNTNRNEVKETPSSHYIEKNAGSNNNSLISLYNKMYQPTEVLTRKKKKTKHYLLIFGVKQSSVLSNDDLELNFERTVTEPYGIEHVTYNINITNKTGKTIYVDKTNCFKIFNDGTSLSYFENTEQITVNKGGGSGASVGLGSIAGAAGIGGVAGQLAGGITVGGGSSHSVSTTYNQQRFIAIPPYGKRNLTEEKYALLKEGPAMWQKYIYQPIIYPEIFDYEELNQSELIYDKVKVVSNEPRFSKLQLPYDLVKTGEVIEYTENNTPLTQSYVITYSTDVDFTNYSSVSFGVYLRQVIGSGKPKKTKNLGGDKRILSDEYIYGISKYTIEGYYNTDLNYKIY